MFYQIENFLKNYQNVISFIALILAIWSLVRTYWIDRYNIDVYNPTYVLHNNWKPRLEFSLFNRSNKPIKIINITVTAYNSIPLNIVEFEPFYENITDIFGNVMPSYIHPNNYADNPINSIVPANSEYKVKLYTDKYAKDIKITIQTDQYIGFCKKTKSFSFPTMKFDKYN